MNGLILLGIDTSGKTASAAVCSENSVLAQTTVYTKLTHSQVILPICREVLKNAGMELSEIDGIAAAAGPGSYTGLRIGISAVEAMCFALGKPCVGISTLESLAYNVSVHRGIICAVMAARLDLVYCAVFSSDGNRVERITDDGILPINELKEKLEAMEGNIAVVGDASERLCEELCGKPEGGRFLLAPPHLRLQLASSLCAAGFGKKLHSPDELEAAYLQITKAEKDLAEKA